MDVSVSARNELRETWWWDWALDFDPLPYLPWFVVVALLFLLLGALVYATWKELASNQERFIPK